MVFSSLSFLLLFLPLLWLAHRLCPPGRWRTRLLFFAGLVFYAWGDLAHLPHLLAMVAFNHAALRLLQRRRERGQSAQPVLGLALAADLAYLAWYKYAGLASATVAAFAAKLGHGDWPLLHVALPLGISFYLFHAMAALFDVARGSCDAPPRLLDTGFYITFFPQHIAGPIVRYKTLAPGLAGAPVPLDDTLAGLRRFCEGLAKKVLLADSLGLWVDLAWRQPAGTLSAPAAWLALGVFPLQLYYDFSGYSDMALGLGRIFGFHFHENFRHPFASRSLTEFWRRWHISFSTWVLDYLYAPLRRRIDGRSGHLAVLLLVFFLSGLWHGAAWTFALWGLCHGAVLLLEAVGVGSRLARLPAWAGRAWVYILCALSGILFRAPDFAASADFSRALLGAHGWGLQLFRGQSPLAWALLLSASVLGAGPGPGRRLQAWSERPRPAWRSWTAGAAYPLLLLVLSMAALGAGSYHPFIYYKF